MTHEDTVFGLLAEANPIPAEEDLDLIDIGGSEYLAILDQRGSEVTRMDTKQDKQMRRNPRHGLLIGLAASVAVVLSAAALILALNNDQPVAATTTLQTQSNQVDLQGQGNRNSSSFQLEGGSYLVETTTTGDCSYRFELGRSGTGHTVQVITSITGPGTTTETLDDVAQNSYFIRVDTDTQFSCPWSMSFTQP